MKFALSIFLGVFMLVKTPVFSQPEYVPKQLKKEIEKLYGKVDYALYEVNIDSLKLQNSKQGKFHKLISSKGVFAYTYSGRVKSCRANGCALPNTKAPDSDYEYFDYFILFDTLRNVQLVRVYNYAATHGYEITSKSWLKQFIGYNGNKNLNVGNDIDAISGATISVYGITADIEIKTKILKTLD